MDDFISQTVSIVIDRPLGSTHPNHPNIVYPINYGYIPGTMSADGEEQDVYLVGVDVPLKTFTGTIIGILKRADDIEDKLVMAPAGIEFSDAEILAQTAFQERYFKTTLHR